MNKSQKIQSLLTYMRGYPESAVWTENRIEREQYSHATSTFAYAHPKIAYCISNPLCKLNISFNIYYFSKPCITYTAQIERAHIYKKYWYIKMYSKI